MWRCSMRRMMGWLRHRSSGRQYDCEACMQPQSRHYVAAWGARVATDTTQAPVTAGNNHEPSSHLDRQILDLRQKLLFRR